MGFYAGAKGCNVYRDGVLMHVPKGEPVPEFSVMSPQGLQSRIKQGIVTADWEEDDVLLQGLVHGAPIVPALPVPLVSTPPVSLKPEALDWWPVETTRGFTAHLVNPDDDGKFLCGKGSQQPDEMPEGFEPNECRSCSRRA